MIGFGGLAFAAPAMLAALIALPLLYWLLKVTPPAPRRERFPAVRLLLGLHAEERTPASAPWWLIALRLAVALLAILGLARPLINPGDALPGNGPVLLVVDDGWAAAKGWRDKQQALFDLTEKAERADRPVQILTTASGMDGRAPALTGLMRAGDARGLLEALQPKPWPSDRMAALKALDGFRAEGSVASVWAADGLGGPGVTELAERLQRLGSLIVLKPDATAMPKLADAGPPEGAGLSVNLARPLSGFSEPASLSALAEDGRILGRADALFDAGSLQTTARFDLPRELRNALARVVVEREETAGATLLYDERWRRRPIGIVTDQAEGAGLTLLSELFYVERALEPVGDLSRAELAVLMRTPLAVMVLPDSSPLTPEDAGTVQDWVERGGLLLRFAGPNLAAAEDDPLVPVRLRRGGRVLSGAMLWSEPARIAAFPETSPFAGLGVPPEVTVTRQVLAEPSLDLNEKTWMRLEDGTPLVTAEPRGDGWIVLVHTTANADWSNLALSGLFVQMLDRLVEFSQGVTAAADIDRPLPPRAILDGFGHLGDAPQAARPLRPLAEGEAAISPARPPGFYGGDISRVALNLGGNIPQPEAMPSLPQGVGLASYRGDAEMDLTGWLLGLALLLLAIDGVVTLWLRGLRPKLPALGAGTGTAAGLALAALIGLGAILAAPGLARAQVSEGEALEALDQTRFAYVLTGDGAIDETSRQGLQALVEMLNARTAVEAGEPMAVDPRRDELAFFPLLYWPVTGSEEPLDAAAADRVNRYMAHGGLILFDTRDRPQAAGAATDAGRALRRLARGLAIPPLEPVPEGHVLTKAFYLLTEFPGRWTGGPVWVASIAEAGNDGVSPVVVGGHDWAGAWARDVAGNPRFPTVPGGERQRELAYRFGINLAMYALTGNYKSDQVHVPAILERLGQ